MRTPSAAFRCAERCDFRAELTEVVYRCPRCHGLLEVAHDMAALAERSGEEWRALFEDRAIAARFGVGRAA